MCSEQSCVCKRMAWTDVFINMGVVECREVAVEPVCEARYSRRGKTRVGKDCVEGAASFVSVLA